MNRMRPIEAAALAAGIAMATLCGPSPLAAAQRAAAPSSARHSVASREHIPIAFEENRGQTDARVRFLARAPGITAFFTPSETVFALCAGSHPSTRDVVRMRFVDASVEPTFVAGAPLPGKSNYFVGDDASKWTVAVPQFDGVVQRGVYSGVDVRWRTGDDGRLTYDVVVSPHVDVAQVALALSGASSVEVEPDGSFRAATEHGEMRHRRPVAFQTIAGVRRDVDVSFVVRDDGVVGFAVGARDADRPLVIDPSIGYATYLGGSGSDGGSIERDAVDSTGALYVAGYTQSTDFPTQSPYQASSAGQSDMFVSKLIPAGSALVYSTYVGGSSSEGANSFCGIAVDSTGAAYLTGTTGSSDFPTVSAVQSSLGGSNSNNDAFVFKLSASGSSLVYSTYLGGSGTEYGEAIAVDSSGAAYVTGRTQSTDFPTQAPLQSAGGGSDDVFVAKLSPSGSSFAYSTYLGGSALDIGYAIAVDSAGAAYVAGWTQSTNFPTQSPFQPSNGGGTNDGFVAKIAAGGSSFVYSSYLGGSAFDGASGIAVDSSGAAYVTGYTQSTNFPTSASPFQTALAGSNDAFISKVAPSGASLVYSTYLGGGGADIPNCIAVDSQGAAVIVGFTVSSDLPTLAATQAAFAGGQDGFVLKVDAAGAHLVFGTYVGGSGIDNAAGVAIDSTGSAYVVGYTRSTNFPTQAPLQATFGGGVQDVFVVKYGPASGGGGGPPPNPPTDLTADYDVVTGVTLTWAHDSTSQDGFVIERKPGNYAFATLANVGGAVRTYTDKNLYPGTTYVYRVRAFSNSNGTSPWSNEADVSIPDTAPRPAPPSPPGGLVADALSDGTIALSWTDASPDELFFDVARAVGGDVVRDLVNLPANTTAYVDEATHPGWPFTYRVRALSLQGASSWSNDATATTPATLDLTVKSGALTDAARAKRDTLKIVATYASGAAASTHSLDPVADGLELQLGSTAGPVRLSIGPSDAGWKLKKTRATKKKPSVVTSATWRSVKGASPKTTIVVDLVHRKVTATLSAFDFVAAPTAEVRSLLACGANGGGRSDTWTGGARGAWRYKAPK